MAVVLVATNAEAVLVLWKLHVPVIVSSWFARVMCAFR